LLSKIRKEMIFSVEKTSDKRKPDWWWNDYGAVIGKEIAG